ncbi:MAG: sensor histidine kinase [Odoribacteraceae bacterium]|jgi:signal transduction histidine kinase|nr:sensor histidine kinase [Odoribacteraceae bacterium]
MLSQIIVYLSLLCQLMALGYAITLFKQTKFNVAWIMISTGLFLMAIYRVIELFPVVDRLANEELYIAKVWLSLVISLVFAVGVFYIRKLFQFLRRLDKIRDETEKRVLSAIIRTEERERQRFAKELHDGLGPLLSVGKMLISGFNAGNAPDVNAKLLHNLQQVADESIASVKEISTNISPHVLNDFGLKEAVSSFISKLRAANGIDIRFQSNIQRQRFSYNVEVIMYRVICELINNTIRHAAATRVRVNLYLEDDILHLDYEDNGRGFDVQQATANGGMGISNMRYRLNSGNGDLQFTSQPGQGLQARAHIHAK